LRRKKARRRSLADLLQAVRADGEDYIVGFLQFEVKPIPRVNSGAAKTPVPSFEILDLQRWMVNIATQESEGTNEFAFEVLVERI
jgi:hypothetical protein